MVWRRRARLFRSTLPKSGGSKLALSDANGKRRDFEAISDPGNSNAILVIH